jgi:hypothetical protein
MEASSCVLIGAARGIADKLPKTLATLKEIAALWSKSAIVIAENGSTDGTKAILREFRASNPDRHRVLTLDAEANAIPARTMRLALVRNKLLDYVHTHYATYEYILMIDLDGILDGFEVGSIQKALQTPVQGGWDALFANSAGKYYDIWALRSSALKVEFDCWDFVRHMQLQVRLPPEFAKEIAVKQYQNVIPADRPPIPVVSAFGGLGLYRLAKTVGCVYNGQTTTCTCTNFIKNIIPGSCFPYTCEHISFHKDMIDKHGAKLFILPSLLVKSQDEHL